MAGTRVRLVAGLGNPGTDYRGTRHNAGFLVVDALAAYASISIKQKKFDTCYGRGNVFGVPLILAKPQAYMNRSGMPLRRLADHFKLAYTDVVVVHDDIDLMFGRLKIKEKGGHGGHKGVKSIIDAFGEDRFVRVRIGVGRSEDGAGVVQHVLGRFNAAEHERLGQLVERARKAVATILCEGTRVGMNRFNRRTIMNAS